jgi:soluble lytic murein transglycosylase
MRPLPFVSVLLSWSCDPSTGAPPAAEAAPPTSEETVSIGPELRAMTWPVSDAVLADLRARRFAPAADALRRIDPGTLLSEDRPQWAFVTAWALVRTDRAADAAPMLSFLTPDAELPAADVSLLTAEIRLATRDFTGAIAAADEVAADAPRWGRAQVVKAEALRGLERVREAFEIYEALAARPDPAVGSAEALLALSQRAGSGNPAGYPYLRRLWAEYPRSESMTDAEPLLAALTGPAYRATWQEVGRRGEVLMERGEFSEASTLLAARRTEVAGDDVHACRFVFALGRAQYKQNQLTNAITSFGDQGLRCTGEGAGPYGAKILYLKGTAQFRRNQYAASADTFLRLADLYRTDKLADDGLLHAGIALQEADRLDAAREVWLRGLEEFPTGDTVPEASFRVAFSYYLAGDPATARQVAGQLGALPLASDPVYVAAGRYWDARWALYPNVATPTVAVTDPAAREAAVAGWTRVCRDTPHSFYAIQAYSRLVEVAPDVAATLQARPPGHDVGDLGEPWVVRRSFAEDPNVKAGVALAQVGLVGDALADWSKVDESTLWPSEKAWLTELRIEAGDWLIAHDNLRQWLKAHPADTLGDQEPQVLRVGYPDRYWAEVQTAAAGKRYEPRLFHALVREESNFNREIRSHAGAVGLSQLMPATAAEVAGWMGRPSAGDLTDPANNLGMGARYLDALHRQLDGSPYVMLAGYNAGAGRVKQWRGEWGNVPTDEYVERIPFKETRDYVKRVMGTWQVYRYQFDTQNPSFPDLSRYNHRTLAE